MGALLQEGRALLAAAGVENPPREARLLMALADGDPALFETLLRRRVAREPYARIAGRREFWSLDFALSPDTLDPRPDSETLIEAALAAFPDRAASLRVLDFGTGSGCLLLAFLSERPNATGIGVDILPGAVDAARANAATLGLAGRAQFRVGDWGGGLDGPADVILANPPYIPSAEIAGLEPEVAAYDPRTALDGGPDGLAAYRRLAGPVARLLIPEGLAFVEIGAGQAGPVEALMAEAGLTLAAQRADLSGVVRCLVFGERRVFGKSFK